MNKTISPTLGAAMLPNWHPGPPSVPPELAGSVALDATGPFEAGSYQSFTLVYTAGRFGIDDTGALKICYRFASDQGRPQFDSPAAPNFVSVEASNGATLDLRFDYKQNTRPWDRTIFIKVVKGFLKEGDTITVRFGNRRGGSPGLRVQTFVDPFFAFRVLVDPIATYSFVEVPDLPTIAIVSGPPARWHAVLPTLRRPGERFRLGLRADDVWGNPSDRVEGRFRLVSSMPVRGLPREIILERGSPFHLVEGLWCDEPGLVEVTLADEAGRSLAVSNPLLIDDQTPYAAYWADLHAQSGETIGSGSAREYFAYARDCAFLDAVGHQGNDFQITQGFWDHLNALTREYNERGRFVTVPGYEWSGNTALGGDRNVFFRSEDRPIRRSSHALVPDHSDIATDCHDARALFRALNESKEDAICFAHCGGRYADIAYAHDPWLERSVEVHSSWGTFEWLLGDALDLGLRVGVVANSDGHKGRPGSEAPGASLFGAMSGLTCYYMPELSRDALFEAMRARRHVATTGARMHLMVQAELPREAALFRDDPRLRGAVSRRGRQALMGDIVAAPDLQELTLSIEVATASPIERLEILDGREVLEVVEPWRGQPLGERLRVIWSGAEYRGRFRMTTWDGELAVTSNEIASVAPINFFNPDRPLRRIGGDRLAWSSVTTGNFAGLDITFAQPRAGRVSIATQFVQVEADLDELVENGRSIDCGGLERRLQVYALPLATTTRRLSLRRTIPIRRRRDHAFYVRVRTEDGHQGWSSPIYAIEAL